MTAKDSQLYVEQDCRSLCGGYRGRVARDGFL